MTKMKMMMATEYYMLASYSSQNHTSEYLAFIWRLCMTSYWGCTDGYFYEEDFKTFHYKNIVKINLPFMVVLYQLTLLEQVFHYILHVKHVNPEAGLILNQWALFEPSRWGTTRQWYTPYI